MEHLVSKRMLHHKSTALAQKIASTIAHLLSFDASLRQVIAQDLVNFCFDLSVIDEAKLLDSNAIVRVGLFSETTGSESDYCLEIGSLDALHASQASAISIIVEFTSRSRSQRLDSEDARRNADARFDWRKSMPIILASVRQILLSPLELARANAAMLSLRPKVAALELLHEFALEWQEIGAASDLEEVIFILVAAIHRYFSTFGKLDVYRERFAELLHNLFLEITLFPPQRRGGWTHDLCGVHSLILPSLFGCISHMPLILTTGVDNEIGFCNLILQSIDLVMINNTALVEGAAHHCATHGVFPALFKLLSVSNVDTRVASIKILQTLVESNGPSFLSTSCRFAVLALGQLDEAESEVKSLENTTPRKARSPTRKRKVVSVSPRASSPVKLVFEPSPKRKRSDRESATPSPQETSTEDSCRNSTVSLSDSFRVFFADVLVKAKRTKRKCQHIPCTLNPLEDDVQLLGDLSGCVSAICLLLPMIWFRQAPEDLPWVSSAVTLLFEALSEASVVLEGACYERRQNLGPEDDRLAKLVGLVMDIGLQTHLGYIRSLKMGQCHVADCLLAFWEVSSRCAWAAMASFARVLSPSSEEYLPWQAFCNQCCFMMRLLNIARPHCRPCLCTLSRKIDGSSEGLLEGRMDLEGSKLPFFVKLISYAFARPCVSRMNNDAGTKRGEIHVTCAPVWKKVVEIMKASDWEKSDSPSLFAVAFLALLPSVVVTATRDVFRGTKTQQVTGRDKVWALDDIYRSVCVSFPHEKFTMLLGPIDVPHRLRIGALIGVAHYRSLLRSNKWKNCESTDVSTALQLAYFTGGDFVRIVAAVDQEPHHSSTSIDRTLRLSLLSMSTEHDENMSPVDRLSKWRIMKDVVLQSSLLELQSLPTVQSAFADPHQNQQVLNIPAVIANIMWVPFADTDYQVRLSASRELGKFLLERNGHVLQSAFGCGEFGTAGMRPVHVAERTAGTISCMFQEIDRLVFHHSCMPQSQLSNTFTAMSVVERRSPGDTALEYQHTALRTIASLSQYAQHDDSYGNLIFKHALLRLVRFWVSLDQYAEDNDGELSSTPLSGLSFSEMRRLARICDFSNLSSAKSLQAFVPALLSEVLLPAAVALVSETGEVCLGDFTLQRQFRLLYSFLESLVLSSPGEGWSRWDTKLRLLRGSVSPGAVACFVDESFHYAIPFMVINKDYDGIRLATGFKLFVLHIHGNSSVGLGDCVVGASIRVFTTRALAAPKSRHGIDEQTKLLCLQPKLIQRILPRLLIENTDRSQLVFFLHIVLQKEMSLQELIASSDKAILRELIWELGGSSNVDLQSIQALKVAALARESATRDSANPGFVEPEPLKIHAHTMASRWVSSHFMFLLVNIVQLKWQDRTLDDQHRALRSLDLMLKFLLPSEAPRFLTQLVATISTAMSQDLMANESAQNRAKIWHLRYLAARSLATYVDIMVDGHLQILGQNLTTFVVTLFPALVPPETRANEDAEEVKIKTDAGEIAVRILEILTHGRIGKELSQYFKEIPFLPSTSLLDKVMENLKSNGVDFDRLLTLSGTQTTQRILTAKDAITIETATEDKEGILPPFSENLLAAMQTRLRVVCPLLSQESASVRLVTLQHLIDLLRANRYLFSRLIEKEDPSTAASVLTVQYASVGKHETRGAVTALVEALLHRVMVENNKKVRLLLGSCLGEVAAIDPHRLGPISSTVHRNEQTGGTTSLVDGRFWQLLHPPWKSSPKDYALYLLTQLLVNALKAASTSAEQHKVAHTIQQLLAIADEGLSWNEGNSAMDVRTLVEIHHQPREKGPMSQWLSERLENEGVLNILEPYWASSFSESVKSGRAKGPPFFSTSDNYFQWISRWCRHMILRAGENSIRCNWCRLLFSCRTAVRSSAGIAASEFILPVLVLERLCFGSSDDDNDIQKELQDTFRLAALPVDRDSPVMKMSFRERQKAVNTAFLLVDTLKLWSDKETEGFYKDGARQDVPGTKPSVLFEDGTWNSTLALEKINDLFDALPLEDMAKAAAALGMHARALQCLEAKARMGFVMPAFDSGKAYTSSGEESSIHLTVQHGFGPHLLSGIDLSLLKEVLGNLDDFPTMKALPKNGFSKVYDKDSIRERESRGDWAGALNDYERALQSVSDPGTRTYLERGSLKCLLEMGQYENVLTQVNGILCRAKATENEKDGGEQAISLAIDAAWRLGRWSVLDALVREHGLRVGSVHAASDFQLAVGKAMLGLHQRSKSDVENALCAARVTLMTKLSSVATEGYERAYPSLVRLQCLKEIEDVNAFFVEGICPPDTNSSPLSKLASSSDVGGWAWDIRLNMASHVDTSIITDVRLALARLAGDAKLERDVFFTMGKKARKSGLLDVASTCFAQAQSVSTPSLENAIGWIGEVQMQLAKLEYHAGQTSAALLILGVVEVKGWGKLSEVERRWQSASRLRAITGQTSVGSDQEVSHDIAKRLLKSTRWIAEGGLKAVPEIMERFRVSNQLRPKWEKSHFEFGKYLDSLLEARIFGVAQHEGWSAEDASVRQYALSEDMNCQNYLHMAMEQYLEALKASDKHVYQALPRVLSLWFEYTSVERRGARRAKAKQSSGDTPLKVSSDPNAYLRNKQEEANQLFHEAAARIPSSMFYTATPQLISRLCHPNPHTGLAVQTLLTRVLSKFPGQAMWALAWVRNSLDKTRSSLGNEIFHSAQKSIIGWAANDKRVDARRKELFDKNRKILVASKSLVSYLIDISKYLPKDERARSFKLSRWRGEVELCDFVPPVQNALATPLDTTKGRDPFPRFRAIHTGVQIMSSKAKPKRVKFYIVPTTSGSLSSPGVASGSAPEDVGELHFLVKNEAKGDLRKDARVQDLNNVINRIMASAEKGKRQRRLRLRTFAVTCLSEDCGLVEWVPNTESFRSLASKSYNPQVPTYSVKRRGKRIANFGDPSLKKNFDDCQNMFFKKGDLTTAARMFEQHFLYSFPPLFYWWFVQNFMDAHAWYDARTNFTTSAAVWSAVGHIIGLGDRHSENLLIDTSSGDCVHVDFDW
jgi:serine/threonine-protein kinase ATR